MYSQRGYPELLKFFGWALGVMFCGAQVVHSYYEPMSQLEELVEIELERLRQAAKAEPK